MLQRLEEETHTNKYIVTEKLPKEMAQQKKILLNLQKVVAEPAMGQSDLDKLHEQVQHYMAVHHSTSQYITVHHSTSHTLYCSCTTLHPTHYIVTTSLYIALHHILHCPFFFIFKE